MKTSADKFFNTDLARLLESVSVAVVCGTATLSRSDLVTFASAR